MRSQNPSFALSWTAMHPIDESSPLYGATPEILAQQEASIIITLIGIDETVSQTIHARHVYIARDILWNMRFVDIMLRTLDGDRYLDYSRFHNVTLL
uniref:hypothetical protein n=1 Tax=Chroococcidiopsis sp. TS-821 TaxID=1378066 RepID=UPI001AEFB38A|nr:hypothetical protein [Chroococcidiopsis sp. TS-821]